MFVAKILRLVLFFASLTFFIPFITSDSSEKYFEFWPILLACMCFGFYKIAVYFEKRKFSFFDIGELSIFCLVFIIQRYVLDHL